LPRARRTYDKKAGDLARMEFIQVAQSPDNNSLPLVLVVAVALVLLAIAPRLRRRKGRRYRRRYVLMPRASDDNGGLADPKNQLEAIAKVDFERQRLLNASEKRVFLALEAMVAELGAGHRVMAQTSVGELLRPKAASGDWKLRKDAYASINSKRFDFAVVDADGMLALAVEYQGGGHHQEKAFMRDAVKREACRRAGVPFLEVEKGMKPAELRQRVMGILAPDVASARPSAAIGSRDQGFANRPASDMV
jgi:hypothetical protein